MDMNEPHVTHCPVPDTVDKAIQTDVAFRTYYRDDYGTLDIIDVQRTTARQGARNWLIHALYGEVEIRSRDPKVTQSLLLPTKAFMQIHGFHWFDIKTVGPSPARLMILELYGENTRVLTNHWSAIDRITMVDTPEGRVWAAWEQTDLRQGVHYDYLAIGPVPEYPETYVEELPLHAHGQSDAFVYVTGGEGVCAFSQQSCPVQEGSFVTVPRGCLYRLIGTPWITAVVIQWNSTSRIVPREEDFLVPLQVPIR